MIYIICNGGENNFAVRARSYNDTLTRRQERTPEVKPVGAHSGHE